MKIDARHHPEKIHPSVFIAPGAQVVGDVTIGAGPSIWYNTVVRGDENRIVIGENTNIQDGCVVHVSEDHPTTLGNNVSLGHGAVVHGATVEDGSLIAMRAVVLDGAHIGAGSLAGAGAVVPEGMVVPPGSLVVGVPARVMGQVKEERQAYLRHLAQEYRELAEVHHQEQRRAQDVNA